MAIGDTWVRGEEPQLETVVAATTDPQQPDRRPEQGPAPAAPTEEEPGSPAQSSEASSSLYNCTSEDWNSDTGCHDGGAEGEAEDPLSPPAPDTSRSFATCSSESSCSDLPDSCCSPEMDDAERSEFGGEGPAEGCCSPAPVPEADCGSAVTEGSGREVHAAFHNSYIEAVKQGKEDPPLCPDPPPHAPGAVVFLGWQEPVPGTVDSNPDSSRGLEKPGWKGEGSGGLHRDYQGPPTGNYSGSPDTSPPLPSDMPIAPTPDASLASSDPSTQPPPAVQSGGYSSDSSKGSVLSTTVGGSEEGEMGRGVASEASSRRSSRTSGTRTRASNSLPRTESSGSFGSMESSRSARSAERRRPRRRNPPAQISSVPGPRPMPGSVQQDTNGDNVYVSSSGVAFLGINSLYTLASGFGGPVTFATAVVGKQLMFGALMHLVGQDHKEVTAVMLAPLYVTGAVGKLACRAFKHGVKTGTTAVGEAAEVVPYWTRRLMTRFVDWLRYHATPRTPTVGNHKDMVEVGFCAGREGAFETRVIPEEEIMKGGIYPSVDDLFEGLGAQPGQSRSSGPKPSAPPIPEGIARNLPPGSQMVYLDLPQADPVPSAPYEEDYVHVPDLSYEPDVVYNPPQL